MSWFSKKLKKFTKVADPIGAKLRKSTGGSYGDPFNWYQSKPNQTQPWQPRQSPGLIPQPEGSPPPGMTFGQNTGGYNYLPNRFQGGGGMMMGGVQGMPGGVMQPPQAPNVQTPTQPPPMQAQGQPQMQQQMMRIGAVRGNYV